MQMLDEKFLTNHISQWGLSAWTLLKIRAPISDLDFSKTYSSKCFLLFICLFILKGVKDRHFFLKVQPSMTNEKSVFKRAKITDECATLSN